MKELSIVKQMVADGQISQEVAEKYFPELKESEDEKIRKGLIEYIKDQQSSFISAPDCRDKYEEEENQKYNSWIAWLEKQGKWNTDNSIWHKVEPNEYVLEKTLICKENGEIDLVEDTILSVTDAKYALPVSFLGIPKSLKKQGEKKSDKVESKFEIGDLITNGILVGEIDEINKLGYHAYFGDHYADIPDVENWHKWTIQDAKEGDVLYAKGSYFKEYLFMFSSFTEDNVISTRFGYDIFHGTFDKKLTRFGREEDFMSVTPATKEQRDLLFQKMKEAGYEWDAEKKELRKVEQKSTWIEEDESIMNAIYKFLDGSDALYVDQQQAKYWLRSLKDRIQPQPKQEWSEEDEKGLGDALWCCKQAASIAKDENDMGNVWFAENWLKSLKDRYTLKPSEEHLHWLKWAINRMPDTEIANEAEAVLEDLLEQLNKLMEE